MKDNAISVANEFIDIANEENKEIRLLGLVKRVYIAHGFSLAMLNKSLLDPRFDKVEAWKYGPVIPSVYHTFKYNGVDPIKEKGKILEWQEEDYKTIMPKLEEEKEKIIVKMVWQMHADKTDSDLVSLTHKDGTPWKLYYEEGKNIEIPDEITKLYYQRFVKIALGE